MADRLLVGVRGDNGCGDVLARGGADIRVREFLRFVKTASGVVTSVQPFSLASCGVLYNLEPALREHTYCVCMHTLGVPVVVLCRAGSVTV